MITLAAFIIGIIVGIQVTRLYIRFLYKRIMVAKRRIRAIPSGHHRRH